MKRVLPIFAILVLFMSGWGAVFASTLCPYARSRNHPEAKSIVTQGEVSSSCHEKMAMGGMEAAEAPSTSVPSDEGGQSAAFEGQRGPCTHCLGRSDFSTNLLVFTREAEQSKRDAGVPVLQPVRFFSLSATTLVPPVRARQHAPPDERTARHLRFSVLLI